MTRSGEVRERAIEAAAIAAYRYGVRAIDAGDDYDCEAESTAIIDALPDELLIDLLVERGALRWFDHRHITLCRPLGPCVCKCRQGDHWGGYGPCVRCKCRTFTAQGGTSDD